jgi:starch synthase
MACGTPVVATATGGIPEVVEDGVTGWLVPIEQTDDGTGTPLEPDKFVTALAGKLNGALANPAEITCFGAAARRRAEEHFSWTQIGRETMTVYREVLEG